MDQRLDVNRVLQKLQQKLNEANSAIIILETQVEQLREELQHYLSEPEAVESDDSDQPRGRLVSVSDEPTD